MQTLYTHLRVSAWLHYILFLSLMFNCRKTCTQHFIPKRYNIRFWIRIIEFVRHLTQNRWIFYVFFHLFDVDVYKHLKDCKKEKQMNHQKRAKKTHALTHNKQKHTFEMREEKKTKILCYCAHVVTTDWFWFVVYLFVILIWDFVMWFILNADKIFWNVDANNHFQNQRVSCVRIVRCEVHKHFC